MDVGRDELVRLARDAASEDRDVALDAIRKLRQLLSNIETAHLHDKAAEHSDGPAHRHWTRHRAGNS